MSPLLLFGLQFTTWVLPLRIPHLAVSARARSRQRPPSGYCVSCRFAMLAAIRSRRITPPYIRNLPVVFAVKARLPHR